MYINKKRFSKKNVSLLDPYVPGYQPKHDEQVIKLNTNENPYPPSENVMNAIKNAVNENLRLYPNPNCDLLKDKLVKTYNVDKSQIYCSNGADEAISNIFRAFIENDDVILMPYPTYSYYKSQADIYDIRYRRMETDANFDIDLERFLKYPSKAIFIANPNPPSGNMISIEEIESFLCKYTGILVVDETYIDFANTKESAYKLINKYNNLLVLRTFSKSFSLCGIRVGYTFGCKYLIHDLNKVKDSYNVSYLSQVAAVSALDDIEYMRKNCKRVVKDREWFAMELEKEGFEVIPSRANFLFIKHKVLMAKIVHKYLVENKIFVRYFDDRRVSEYLRITIGKKEELEKVLEVLRNFQNSYVR